MQVILSGLGTAFGLSLLTWLSGTSCSELAWGLIGQHRRFTVEFYHSIPVYCSAYGFAGLALVLLLPVFRKWRSASSLWLLALGFFVAIGCIICDIGRPLCHGLEPRGASPWLVLAGPALGIWSLQFPAGRQDSRNLFAGIVFLGPLMAVPTPGTQLSIATAGTWLVLGLLLDSTARAIQAKEVLNRMSMLLKPSPLAVYFVPIVLVSAGSVPAWYRFLTYEPIRLNGATWVRLDPSLALVQRRIADAIVNTNCDAIAFDGHNHNRFFFWTNHRPLTAANPTFWPRMLTHEEQQRWMRALRESEKVCVVLPPENELLAGSFSSEVRSTLLDGFVETHQVDGWRIGIRRRTRWTRISPNSEFDPM